MPTVTTNTAANSALRYLNQNNEQSQSSISKIASGSRIVRASDDAAGLAIGTRLVSDVMVLEQAARNASQGISVLQVADGGFARIHDVLMRMKTLSAASLSGVPTDNERQFINSEYQELIGEINGIAQTTRFNGEPLMDGTSPQWNAPVDFFVGSAAGDVVTVDMNNLVGGTTYNLATAADFQATSLSGDLGGTNTVLSTTAVDNVANAANSLAVVDNVIDLISDARASVGALISRFEFRAEQIATSVENVDAAQSVIMDVDIAAEQSNLVSSQVLVQASVSALSQANQLPQTLLRLLQ